MGATVINYTWRRLHYHNRGTYRSGILNRILYDRVANAKNKSRPYARYPRRAEFLTNVTRTIERYEAEGGNKNRGIMHFSLKWTRNLALNFFFFFTLNCLIHVRYGWCTGAEISYSMAADATYSHVIQKMWKIKKKFGCSFAYASSTSVGINMAILNSFCIFQLFSCMHKKFQGFFFYISRIEC